MRNMGLSARWRCRQHCGSDAGGDGGLENTELLRGHPLPDAPWMQPLMTHQGLTFSHLQPGALSSLFQAAARVCMQLGIDPAAMTSLQEGSGQWNEK